MIEYDFTFTDIMDLIYKIKQQDYQLGCSLEKDIVIQKKTGKLLYIGKTISSILQRIVITD